MNSLKTTPTIWDEKMNTQPEALRLADALEAGDNFFAESSLRFDFKLSDTVADAAQELRRLHQCLRNVYEVLAGNGYIPNPTAERLLNIIEQMRDAAKEGLK